MSKDIHVQPTSGGGYSTDVSGTSASPGAGGKINVHTSSGGVNVDPTTYRTDTPGVSATPDYRGGFFLESAGEAAGGAIAGAAGSFFLFIIGIIFLASIILIPILAIGVPIFLWVKLLVDTIKNRKACKKWSSSEVLFYLLTAFYLIGGMVVSVASIAVMVPIVSANREAQLERMKWLQEQQAEIDWALANPSRAITMETEEDFDDDGSWSGDYVQLTNNTSKLDFDLSQAPGCNGGISWLHPQETTTFRCYGRQWAGGDRCFEGQFYVPTYPGDRWVEGFNGTIDFPVRLCTLGR